MTRLEHIDIAKGLGIILVIVAHGIGGFTEKLIFCFHMPLFFLISGLLFRPTPAGPYLRKKAIHLLLPYSVFLLFFVLIDPTPQLLTILDRADYAHPFWVALHGGQHLVSYAIVFWFVTCLFLTQQIFNGLALRLSRPALALVAGACYVVSLLDAAYLHAPWPWGINICLAAIPFFAVGYLAGPSFVNGRGLLAALAMFLVCAWAAARFGYAVTYNMKYTHYGVPGVSAIFALAGSKLVLELSRALQKLPALSRPLIWCGAASMLIMFLGQWVMYKINDTRLWDQAALKVAAGITLPLGLHWIANRFWVLRALVLGNNRDFEVLLRHILPSKRDS